MRKILYTLLFVMAIGLLYGQPNAVASEVQAFYDAREQTEKIYWSQLLLGFSVASVTAIAACLLANLRTLAFFFLIIYGGMIISVPYYIPTRFQGIFGMATLILGVVGFLYRLLALLSRPKKSPAESTPAQPKA